MNKPFEWLIEKAFTYHPPKPDQIPRYEQIRARAKDLAVFIRDCCPEDTYELGAALMKLQEVVMWANAAIARSE